MFEGSNHYGRYSDIFMNIVKEHMEEKKVFGVSGGDIRTHLSREGVAAMVFMG